MTFRQTMEFFERTLDEEGNVKEINDEVIEYIRERYTAPVIPACRVCGGKLENVRSEPGKRVYAHPRPDGVGFDEWQEHYTKSYWDYIPKEDIYVLALLEAYEALQQKVR